MVNGRGKGDMVYQFVVEIPTKLKSKEREMLQAAIDHSQERVSGTVRMKLYKGVAGVVGRKSTNSLYSESHVTFEDDAGAYDQKDAEGFIKLNALRLKLLAKRDKS